MLTVGRDFSAVLDEASIAELADGLLKLLPGQRQGHSFNYIRSDAGEFKSALMRAIFGSKTLVLNLNDLQSVPRQSVRPAC